MGRGEGSINTSLGSSLLLRFIRHPGNEEAAVFLRLEIPDASAIESSSNGFVEPLEILSHNAIPLFVYGEDLDEALSGKLVTKAIYIPRNLTAESGSGSSLFNRVDSWKLEPAADPVKMAAESGTVVAILRLSTRVEAFSKDAAD